MGAAAIMANKRCDENLSDVMDVINQFATISFQSALDFKKHMSNPRAALPN